ncbi:MAG: hypothetical protein RIA69_14235 [Cyclobacteriaceae bacterium]
MRLYLLKILKFGLFAFTFLFIFGSAIWINIGFTHGFLANRIEELKQIAHPDVLFVGSSRCYRGFDTRIFAEHGIEGFNLGSSAQSLEQSYLLLNKYVDEVKPKTIILEVAARSLEADGIESTLDLLANVPLDKELCWSALTTKNPQTHLALMAAIARQILGISPTFRSSSRDKYVPFGFVERVNQSYQDNKKFVANSTYTNVREKNVESLDKIVEMTAKRGIKLILVQVPVISQRYKTHADREAIDEFFSKRGYYLNFNNKLSFLTSEYFFDSSHLNNRGVEVFDELLISTLRKDGVFDF